MMNESDPQQKKKTFKPLVLFHDDDPGHSSKLNQQNDSQLHDRIEQHRLKTMQMLKHNSQLWENKASYTNEPFDLIVSGRPSPEVPTDACYPTITDHCTNVDNGATYGNQIKPPAHDSKGSYSQTSPATNLDAEDNEKEASNEITQKPIIGTTFIVEPRYHLVYNPNFGRKRKRENLPKNVTEYLKEWLIIHKKHPYPTEREKQKLAEETSLTVSQISNWFINARRRILQPLLESESNPPPLQTTTATSFQLQNDSVSYDYGPYHTRYDDETNNMTTNDDNCKGKEKHN